MNPQDEVVKSKELKFSFNADAKTIKVEQVCIVIRPFMDLDVSKASELQKQLSDAIAQAGQAPVDPSLPVDPNAPVQPTDGQ